MADEETVVDVAEATAVEPQTTAETTTEPGVELSQATETKSVDDELLDVWVKHNAPEQQQPRARTPDGKFAPTQQLNQDQQPLQAKEPEQAKAAATPPAELPYSWSADKKARLAALPPEYRDVVEYATLRDKQVNQALSKAGDIVKQYEQTLGGYKELDQLVDHYKADFIRRGVSPVQAFATLLNAQTMLDSNPRDGLVKIAATYGIDLRAPLYGPGAEQQQAHPVIAQLSERLQHLQSKVDGYEGKFSQQEQAQAQAESQAKERESNELQNEVSTFSNGKPYFEEVKPVMAALLRAGQAKDLPDAYDMAVNAHPQIRTRIQQDQRAKEEAERTSQAKIKAEAARKASVINVRGGPSGHTPKTIDDTLRETAGRLYS